MDRGYELTEALLKKLERKIGSVYTEAAEEMQKTIDEYLARFIGRDEEMREAMEREEITPAQYQQWRMTQIARGERYEAMRDELAERATKANEVAVAYVNDETPGIYSLNRNYTAYVIEQAAGDCGFDLFDEQTVKRLIKEQPDLMPHYPEKRAVRRGIDLAYGKKQITAGIRSGILQGKTVRGIADDLQKRITSMNRASAIRTARTAVTTAQNAGRQDSYEAAAKMGIRVRKRWIAAKDARTRHDHGAADGQIVMWDEPFEVGGFEMMFPGDRSGGAPGRLIYNCRCTMATVEKDGIEAEPRQMRVRNPATGRNELISEMTFEQWATWKREQDPEAFDIALKKAANAASDRNQHEKYRQLLGKHVPKSFADFQEMKYNNSEQWNFIKIDAGRRRKLMKHPELALPAAERAIAEDAKFTRYLFNPENEKGWIKGLLFTRRLGYSQKNWNSLQSEILHGARLYPAVFKESNAYGDLYEQQMILYGTTNNPSNVVVGWIYKPDDSVSMTTAYIKEAKK